MAIEPNEHNNNPNRHGVYGYTPEEWAPYEVTDLRRGEGDEDLTDDIGEDGEHLHWDGGIPPRDASKYRSFMRQGRLFQVGGFLVKVNDTGTGIVICGNKYGLSHPVMRMRHHSKSRNTLLVRLQAEIEGAYAHGGYECEVRGETDTS